MVELAELDPVLYRYPGSVFRRELRTWNFRIVGAYFMPDIALLMFLAIVPDLLQGIYMTAIVFVDHFNSRAMRSYETSSR